MILTKDKDYSISVLNISRSGLNISSKVLKQNLYVLLQTIDVLITAVFCKRQAKKSHKGH